MSELIAIVGSSGEGKSTSIETLNPKETFIINVVGKPLPFRGWKANYTLADPKTNSGNYIVTANSKEICGVLNKISKDYLHIKQVVLDDSQYTMSTTFMEKALEKGYDKFSIIGQDMWHILNTGKSLRDDLKVFMLFHDEVINESYDPQRKIKTIGKMLDQNVTLEGLFTIVLFTRVTKDENKENLFQFVTQKENNNTAKSPRGMFEKYIPNDLAYVVKKIDEYYNG